ncbi:MAG: transposase, partial [Promethearchaeota archaeon]
LSFSLGCTQPVDRHNLGVKSLFIEPGSPYENDYIESFKGKLREELLNREIFTTLIEQCRKEYNQLQPHSALCYQPPAPEATIPVIMPMGLT